MVIPSTLMARLWDGAQVFILLRPCSPVHDPADAGHVHLQVPGDLGRSNAIAEVQQPDLAHGLGVEEGVGVADAWVGMWGHQS